MGLFDDLQGQVDSQGQRGKGGASGAWRQTGLGRIDDHLGNPLEQGFKGLLSGLQRKSNQPGLNEGNFNLSGQHGRSQSLLQQADFAAGRGAPQVTGSEFRGDQRGLIDMLNARARGQGESVAQMQLKDALGQNLSSQQALLATGGPGGARAASQAAGQLGGSIGGQAAQLRANEMTAAQGLLGQVTGQARGQDQNFQQLQSDNELRSRGLNDQQIARLRQQELQNAQFGLQGRMGLEQERTKRRGQDLGVPTATETAVSGASGLLSFL